MPRSTLLVGCLAFAAIESIAAAQFVPVRQLDTNGVYIADVPFRVRSGLAVGEGFRSGSIFSEATLWDAAGSNPLPTLAGQREGFALDFQVGGDVVGYCDDGSIFHAVATLWQNGSAIDLNSLVTGGPSMTLLWCSAIDSKGRITGFDEQSSIYGGFLFDQGVLTDLGALPGETYGVEPTSMNDHLQIVGSAVSGRFAHAVLWDNGTLIDLHDPAQISGKNSNALGIDRFGRICGFAEYKVNGSRREEAVLWDHGTVVDLGANASGPTNAGGMNDFGEIVGALQDPVLGIRACRFENGGITDLNTLIDPASGWTLGQANGVDDEGRIVGIGMFQGQWRAFILEPDCKGTFTVYGTGCPGTGGIVPRLFGAGCPAPDRDFALAVADGVPNAIGYLFVGASNGSITIKPGCDLEVLPLIAPPLLESLDGFGEQWIAANLPSGTPIFDVYLQELFFDAGAAFGISATLPLALHFE